MGNSFLAMFESPLEAVRCAIVIQQGMAMRILTEPEDSKMQYRIGVNLGDIIVEGDDIQGDGVNVADRIQALAEPGGIAISGTAYDHVKSKLAVGYISLGEQKVKNLNLILKADVQGSLEALTKELEKLENPEVPIRILLKGVGGISESDILLADASQAIVIGFRVAPEDGAPAFPQDDRPRRRIRRTEGQKGRHGGKVTRPSSS